MYRIKLWSIIQLLGCRRTKIFFATEILFDTIGGCKISPNCATNSVEKEIVIHIGNNIEYSVYCIKKLSYRNSFSSAHFIWSYFILT